MVRFDYRACKTLASFGRRFSPLRARGHPRWFADFLAVQTASAHSLIPQPPRPEHFMQECQLPAEERAHWRILEAETSHEVY